MNIRIRRSRSAAGVPRGDGSGGGTRANAGRGGCALPRRIGRGRRN